MAVAEPLLFAIRAATGISLAPGLVRAVPGGSINSCYAARARDGRMLFLKLNEPDCGPMFAAEYEGLRALAAAGEVRVPLPLAHGVAGDAAWLLLEHLELEPGSHAAGAKLGAALAAQHRHSAAAFGWGLDNTIGTTAQANQWHADWTGFFGKRRLGFQLRLAAASGDAAIAGRGARLLAALPGLLAGHSPPPSLLHGDLWAGNWAMTSDGMPVIFDPAVYYGDREADLAMTELFGGFPPAFYEAYEAAWPLAPGYAQRRDIYNLYHVLNHLNLFGGSYRGQAISLMDRLLAD